MASRLPNDPPQRHILTSSVLGCSFGILAFPHAGSLVLNVTEETDKRRGDCVKESTWQTFFVKPVITGEGGVGKITLMSPRSVLPDAFCMLQENHEERLREEASGIDRSVVTIGRYGSSGRYGRAMLAGFARVNDEFARQNGAEELRFVSAKRRGTKPGGSDTAEFEESVLKEEAPRGTDRV